MSLPPEEEFLCPSCNNIFYSIEYLIAHFEESLRFDDDTHKQTVKCLFCDVYCNGSQSMLHHLYTEHIQEWPTSSKNDVLLEPISEVSSTTPTIKEGTVSKRIIKNERKHGCGFCEKKFTRPADVRRHERIHTGERPYACRICNSSFKTRHQLTQHYAIHDNAQPSEFICEVCRKAYFTKGALTLHLRTHNNTNPFSCSYPGCSQAFHTNQLLKRHIKRSHPQKQVIDKKGILKTIEKISPSKTNHQIIKQSENSAFDLQIPEPPPYEHHITYPTQIVVTDPSETISCVDPVIIYESVDSVSGNIESTTIIPTQMYQTVEPIYHEMMPSYPQSVYHTEESWDYSTEYPRTN
ncbi:Zinc finger, C2H2 domain and Zinc finger C2H2-type/integrase DNA-binding domain and Zinc finger, C2H2-like domain-containing protein [Strongyloides ratti]|uniref:Zinc finger, C2H2 domain and Zinc finger C2H2-type/integrase DNA-binding domain and Zinc finger, C2H2-like domain-containing protein n=1 Tax=Strongyloides ratti TaxID=34506 RepID=A0A090L223_STRRB|nr:Zinc finger, C2H2 domain and Zinc finger C2H2-type/integrase DNA-binding domain and Zinc finger, C2H2-like domain-containing protein [Strongyloides ratti]CEF63861.1 Zinc finger, C2H2 domain and Zinc finger C2H2-type/integrase DNA-binding domain and Zinc finger, C2H2-like domain-containing protein [Strongyloides ratti]